MGSASIAWGLVVILALALLWLWRRSDKRGKKVERLKAENEILIRKLEARDAQDKIDRAVNVRNTDLDDKLRADRKTRPDAYG